MLTAFFSDQYIMLYTWAIYFLNVYHSFIAMYTHSLPFHQGDSMELETWCLEMNEKWVHFGISLLFLTCVDITCA